MDSGIHMRGRNMRANLIKRRELLFKRSKDNDDAGVARLGRSQVLQSQVPIVQGCPANPRDLRTTAEADRISR